MNARQGRLAVFVAAVPVLAGIVAWAIVDPRTAATGWLVGFVFWAQILLGSLSLMMIHRLTSGRWGEIIAPVMEPAVRAVPWLFLLVIPLFLAIPVLYPWARHSPLVKPDVLSLYLNQPAFMVRSSLALAGWSAFAIVLARGGASRAQVLTAALGLLFHAVAISSVSIDWYLSLEAPFTSSSFGASIAVCSLVAALAWAAVWMPVRETDPAIGDVGALLLATVLGLTYIDFMAVLVIWYGDLPREEVWFVTRDRLPWTAMAACAFALGAVFPILALIQSRFRNHRRPLRAVGVVTLIGIAVYDGYLIAPRSGALALVTSSLAWCGIGLVLMGAASFFASRPPAFAQEAEDVT
jgi:hypothetical protein